MSEREMLRRTFLGALALAAGPLAWSTLRGEEARQVRENLHEPVFRVANNKIDPHASETGHPLDPAIKLAREALERIQRDVRDYECMLVKQERIKGELKDAEYIQTKIRNRQVVNGQVVSPLSVYMYFLKPASNKGREVIWIEGQNNNKMIAHEGNFLKTFGSVWLDPHGTLAMKGNLYPITDVGIENLILKLIEKANRDRARAECEVTFSKGSKVNDRVCTMLRVVHPQPRDYFDFHIAEVFIDDELNLPIRYAAYTWPQTPGSEPPVIEAYTYLKLKVNVGLTDQDFDPKNTKYKF